jgi:hypothetical protein
MTNLLPLWQIEDELAALIDSVDTCPEELRPELETRISEYLGAEAAKLDRVNAVFNSLDAVQRNAKLEIERLRARQQSAQKAAERLEEYILRLLRAREGRPLKGRNITFSARQSEAVIIDDPQLIPDQWKKLTVTVDIPKIPIREAIKGGTIVPGAHIEVRDNLYRR